MKIKIGIATIISMALLSLTIIANHISIIPIHDPQHFTGIIVGNPDHAYVIGHANQSGFIAWPAAME